MAWYNARFELNFQTLTGNEFEAFVTSSLQELHPGFSNPRPVGSRGDGGCDGITYEGDIAYATFGYLSNRGEAKLSAKISSDFKRVKSEWATFTTWRFVTNVGPGPDATKTLIGLRKEHGPTSDRPLLIEMWDHNQLWDTLQESLSLNQWNKLLPGVPHVQNVKLSDIIPLLDELSTYIVAADVGAPVDTVPATKTDFNSISLPNQIEFQVGRVHTHRLSEWYRKQVDPTLRDTHGQRFQAIYRELRNHSTATVESLYIALAGTDFRLDPDRANAVYTVVAFFFDECDIFEVPPPGWSRS